jgi:hypothetical protein
MRSGVDDEWGTGAAFDLAVGWAGVVVAAFTAAILFGPAEQVDRAVVMAIGAAVLAAVLRDWRSTAGITVLAALVFVGFLAHQAGQLTGDPAPWRYTLIIGVAAMVGRAGRAIRAALRHRDRAWPPAGRLFRRRGDRSAARARSASVRS